MPERAAHSLSCQIHVSYFNVPFNLVIVTVCVRKYPQNVHIFSLKKVSLLNVNTKSKPGTSLFLQRLIGLQHSIVFHSYWHQRSRSAYHMHQRREILHLWAEVVRLQTLIKDSQQSIPTIFCMSMAQASSQSFISDVFPAIF